jgi:tetratricopeptide (TPR) repeat protein
VILEPDPNLADSAAKAPEDFFRRAMARLAVGRDDDARGDLLACKTALGDSALIELAFLDIRQRHDITDALDVAHEIITRAAPGSALQARAHHVAGLAEGKLRRTAPALVGLLKASRIYTKLNDLAARAQVQDTIGSIEAARGRLDLAVNSYAMSLVDKSLSGDKAGMALTLGNIGRAQLRLGRFEDALNCFERDLELSIELGDVHAQARMHEDIGRTKFAAGDYEAAETSLSQCIELSKTHHYADLAFFAAKDLAILRIAQSRFDDARTLLGQAVDYLPEGAEPYLHQTLTAARGELALAAHDAEAARMLETAVDCFAAGDLPDLEIPARILLARALSEQMLKATAQECLLKAMQRARADGYARYLPQLRQEMANLDLIEGIVEEPSRAIKHKSAADMPTTDGYVLLQRIGGGGFGDVYRAFDPVRACEVALKRFRIGKLYDARKRAILIKSARVELEAALRLRHPGIVRVRAIGFDDNNELYLVSDFIEGISLRKQMSQTLRPDHYTVFRQLEPIAAALVALHEAGIVHRDLKPENVIITPDGLPVLVDLGIAQLTNSRDAQSAPFAGTPSYMSPEQAKGAAVDGQSDVYALGVMSYEWLAGFPPIQPKSADQRQLALELTATIPIPLKKIRPDLPIEVVKLITQMLGKWPSERPTALEFMEASRKLKGTANSGNAPVTR